MIFERLQKEFELARASQTQGSFIHHLSTYQRLVLLLLLVITLYVRLH